MAEQLYLISWEIQLEADTPEEAARLALAVQRDPHSSATAFTVTEENGDAHSIDLEDEA